MKIAVTSQNLRTVTPHAGRTRRFLVFEAGADGEPVEVDRLELASGRAMHDVRDDDPHPLDAVDVVIAGSCGEGFVRRMARRGIVAVTTGVSDPLAAVRAFLAEHPVGGGGVPRREHRRDRCHGRPSAAPAAEHGCGHRHADRPHLGHHPCHQHRHQHRHQHHHQRGPGRSAGGATP